MFSKLLGESQLRRIVTQLLVRIVDPLNRFVLSTRSLHKIQRRIRARDLIFHFRPFVLSDLIVLFTDWESYVRNVFKPQKGDIVFDIGAHIGIYTLMAAKSIGKKGLVIAFEPDCENFQLLKKNVEANGFKNVKLINAALGKTKTRRVFYISINPLWSSFSPPINISERKLVQVTTLDNVMEELCLSHVDWVKIDVEGWELNVLEGGKNTISNYAKRIIIETNNEKALKFLAQMGFTIHKLFDLYFFADKRE